MIKIKKIDKIEFNLLDIPALLNEDKGNKCYAIVSNGILNYKIAWQSDLLSPLILKISNNIYCIGIDQFFYVVDFSKYNILLNLKLAYYFYDVKIFQKWIFVITELEIIRVNNDTFIIENEYSLPDFYERISFLDNSIKVKCLNVDQLVCFLL